MLFCQVTDASVNLPKGTFHLWYKLKQADSGHTNICIFIYLFDCSLIIIPGPILMKVSWCYPEPF